MKMGSEVSKTEEVSKTSEVVETVKEKFEDCKERASEGLDTVKEEVSEVVDAVKGETDCRMLITFAILTAFSSGCLAHKGGDSVPAALFLGGEKTSVLDSFLRSKTYFPGVSIFFAWASVNNQKK